MVTFIQSYLTLNHIPLTILLHQRLESAMITPCQCITEFHPTLSSGNIHFSLSSLIIRRILFQGIGMCLFVCFCFIYVSLSFTSSFIAPKKSLLLHWQLLSSIPLSYVEFPHFLVIVISTHWLFSLYFYTKKWEVRKGI